jgi:extradiol dioxygenase family protein
LAEGSAARHHNPVDGHDVPVPHFGAVLDMATWRDLAERLRAAGTAFVIEPTVRFEGQPGEQATMFFIDPSGNAIEFKAMARPEKLFAK